MQNFNNKVAVITGGASGVGRSIGLRLGREGAKIVLADIERKALDKTVEEFKAKGIDTIGVVADVTKYESMEALAEQSFGHFGAVHLLFNNAGVGPAEAPNLWDAPLKEWAWGMNVNVWGVVHGLKAFMPRLVAQNQEAFVVNTTSGNGGQIHQPFTPIYAATKAAVTSITEVLHFQLRAQQSPIKVAALFPGPHVVDTGIYNSERNRPKELEDANVPAKSVHSLDEMKAQMAGFGIKIEVTTPDEVAEEVYQSLRKDEYWILPMTNTLIDAVRARTEDMLARRNPVHRDVL
jgi:NAD(P)-dependent dehydrogenase (short-subunit alcohol dehydrogenase family)